MTKDETRLTSDVRFPEAEKPLNFEDFVPPNPLIPSWMNSYLPENVTLKEISFGVGGIIASMAIMGTFSIFGELMSKVGMVLCAGTVIAVNSSWLARYNYATSELQKAKNERKRRTTK